MNFGSKWPNCFWEKQVLTLKSEWPLIKVKEWPWPLILTQLHKLIYLNASSNFETQGCNSFQKINNFHFFPYKSLCDQIWPWRKMGQGQPRVIIWTTLVVLPYTMLHTKFQGHWSIGSGEEDFLRLLPYMGMAAMLVMWPRSFEQLFFPKGSGGCIWNLVAIGPVVSEEKSFEIVDGRRTDGRRTTEPAYTISSPGAFGSGELKKRKKILCGNTDLELRDKSEYRGKFKAYYSYLTRII